MAVSFFSFVAALMWSTIFILLTYKVRKINRMKKYYGIGLLALLYFFSVFRIFLPLEFGFTQIIPSKVVYAKIYGALYLEQEELFEKFHIVGVLVSIWFIVAIVLIGKFIIEYRRVHECIMKLSKPCVGREAEVLDTIKIELNKYINVNIYKSSYISTPIAIGLFNKTIILTDGSYTDKELYYILLHEYTHFINKDVIVKIMTDIFCYFYWWYPTMRLLKKDLEEVLEIKCDLCVINNMQKQEKVEYLSVIINIIKNSKRTREEALIGVGFAKEKRRLEITKRFETIIEYVPNKRKVMFSAMIFTGFIAMDIFSYSFIIQPHYDAPEGIEISMKDAYIIQTKEGKYLFYINDELYSELRDETAEVFIEYGYQLKEVQ